eukprot:gene1054-730_t
MEQQVTMSRASLERSRDGNYPTVPPPTAIQTGQQKPQVFQPPPAPNYALLPSTMQPKVQPPLQTPETYPMPVSTANNNSFGSPTYQNLSYSNTMSPANQFNTSPGSVDRTYAATYGGSNMPGNYFAQQSSVYEGSPVSTNTYFTNNYSASPSQKLSMTAILNDFYGCADQSGWDDWKVDNWRLLSKRWGFGKREDKDTQMFERLGAVVEQIDPNTWNVTGDPEWESPFGILAQIALFDQVSRMVFFGTPNAFKWDELARRATRVAIDKGYFETSYRSTLNQFVVLLPLEHSESWEDQKLAVKLLLGCLAKSTMDENAPDGTIYSREEILKRLELSKRLALAFMEHAQVIAKFGRYPHRNRVLGRETTMEERFWLASDNVPKWAAVRADKTKSDLNIDGSRDHPRWNKFKGKMKEFFEPVGQPTKIG